MSLTLAGPVSGEFFAGNDFSWEFTVTLDDEVVDLSGMTCKFVMARRGLVPVLTTEVSPPTVVISLNSPPTDGIFRVVVDHEDTDGLIGTYDFQAQVEDALGDRSNVLHGFFTFRPSLFES